MVPTQRVTELMRNDVGIAPVVDRNLLAPTDLANIGPVAAMSADLNPVGLVRPLHEQHAAMRFDNTHRRSDPILIRLRNIRIERIWNNALVPVVRRI